MSIDINSVSFSYGGEEVLHDGPVLLLDEPTSNLDSMNEGIILKSLMEEKLSESKKRTVIIVSHRLSTLGICDVIYKMETA